MNPRYVIHEEIDRYLNGKMAAAERRLFEAELASNPSVRAEFEAQQIAHQIIVEDSLLDLKKQMQRDMNGGGSTPPSSNLGRNYRNWLIGLGGLLCVSSLYYFYSNSNPSDPNTKAATTSAAQPIAPQQTATQENNAPVIAAPRGASAEPTQAATSAPQQSVVSQNAQTSGPIAVDYTPNPVVKPIEPTPQQHTSTTTIQQGATPTVQNKPEVTTPAPDHTPDPAPEARPTAYTFQPDVEGNWVLPYKENTRGTFKIISRSGSTVYQTSFSSGTTEWNGNDAAGVPLPGGYYIYLIEYEQGNADKGSLTILR